ncbi:MAG: histidine kinase [Bacteroidota bacterium]
MKLEDTIFQFDKLAQIEVALKANSNPPTTFFYQLASMDTSWYCTTYPLIRYTNLPPSTHRLYIRQLGQPDSLTLTFQNNQLAVDHTTPWWLQSLLVFCLLLIPFTIIYFITLHRSRRILQLEIVRNQIASDLHDDVSGNLSAIKNMNELLMLTHQDTLPDSAIELSKKMTTFSERAITKLRHTVWAINPHNDTVEELIEKMETTASEMLATKPIPLVFQNTCNNPSQLQFDMQQRHNTLLIFNELIHNALKHSEAKTVHVDLCNTTRQLMIQVKDDGVGFDLAQKIRSDQLGLKSLQERAQNNFIKLELQSTIGAGTVATLTVNSMA